MPTTTKMVKVRETTLLAAASASAFVGVVEGKPESLLTTGGCMIGGGLLMIGPGLLIGGFIAGGLNPPRFIGGAPGGLPMIPPALPLPMPLIKVTPQAGQV